jgi:hypothetical protein
MKFNVTSFLPLLPRNLTTFLLAVIFEQFIHQFRSKRHHHLLTGSVPSAL